VYFSIGHSVANMPSGPSLDFTHHYANFKKKLSFALHQLMLIHENIHTMLKNPTISTLKCNDVVVLWGGANDISRNNTKEALKNLSNFINVNKKVNIVLINSLLRYDLVLSSCVNNEVVKFNRQLKKRLKLHANVELLEVELQRKHFTRHGKHLNYSGKDLVSLELAKSIEQLLNKVKAAPIQIQWKDDNLEDLNLDIHSKIVNPMGLCTNEEPPKSSKCDVGKTKSDNKTKASIRPRKVPVTRSNDFLW
jgi:hypothetical protein